MVVGCWLLVVGRWSLVVGRWSLVVGRWSLVVGRWSLVVVVGVCVSVIIDSEGVVLVLDDSTATGEVVTSVVVG
ncbi:hypothetical protein [Streptococcus canis]